jgi:pimeloyl-ACP methyl ester carboxylesterase
MGKRMVATQRLGLVASVVVAAACRPTAQNINRTSDLVTRISIDVPGAAPLQTDLYGVGDRGVVILAHGGYSTLASWAAEAKTIAGVGYRVLVVEARAAAEFAAGRETPCLYDEACMAKDVLAGVRYMRALGVNSIALMGGSMGGAAVAQASVEAESGAIQHIVLLAPGSIGAPERVQGRKLFITTREDANAAGLRLPTIRAQYDAASEPKRLLVLEGSAHAQRIFLTADGDMVMRDILEFLRTR